LSFHLTTSHGFPAAPTDVPQALAAEPIDALPAAVVALPADAQEQAAACKYYVPSAVAERACKSAAADCAADPSVPAAACLHCSNVLPVQVSADDYRVSD
jgi:hypothetical protein